MMFTESPQMMFEIDGSLIFASSTHGHLFVLCPQWIDFPRTIAGYFRITGEWKLCRIREQNLDGTFNILWENGDVQFHTLGSELKFPSEALSNEIENTMAQIALRRLTGSESLELERPNGVVAINNGEEDDASVWEAARNGDSYRVLRLIDIGGARVNDLEISRSSPSPGHSLLYWACATKNVSLVRELIARGGYDVDGEASDALEQSLDNTLMGGQVFHDATAEESLSTTDSDAKALIKAMLAVASAVPFRGSDQSMRQKLPQQLYRTTAEDSMRQEECVVCLEVSDSLAIAVPCGHISCCHSCLDALKCQGSGCPICRATIAAVVPYNP